MEILFYLYFVCFGVGLVFTLISALAADVFGGHDVHVDTGGVGHDVPAFSPLSPSTIAAFITSFGGFGMILSKIDATSSPWVSAPIAALGGFMIAAALIWFFQKVFNWAQSSSEAQVVDLLGETATVITPIPENGVGEIAYVQTGSRYSAPAREETGLPVSNGKTVRITRIVGTQFYVIALG